ncbi:hypothetical protein H5410_051751 [Solanum commersonii]|uniref:Uncharacterized protein n=1 Tax=Solanum commersonii TaxID=4109 RepID=A0A9J5X1E7_SOLCO|nr:hypothetical protein H5410_051751 [Solanum commersonii]
MAWLSDPTHIGPSAGGLANTPKLAWFQDVESIFESPFGRLLGLGSLSGHQVHVSLPINQFLNGVDPKEIPLPHEFILNRDLLAQLYPALPRSNPAFHLELRVTCIGPTGIGHGLKDILEAHKGPFTCRGHKGLYEILTTPWHAQLSLNLAMLGSLTIVVAHHMYSMPLIRI